MPVKEKIFIAISNNPKITKAEISLLIGVSDTTVDKGIAALKKNGKIVRVGSNKPGSWKINN